jgi:hypothetical protein
MTHHTLELICDSQSTFVFVALAALSWILDVIDRISAHDSEGGPILASMQFGISTPVRSRFVITMRSRHAVGEDKHHE